MSKPYLNRKLIRACKYGDLPLIKTLVEDKGCDIHTKDEEPLIMAVEYNQLDVVKYLVSKGCDIHYDDDYALRWACNYGYKSIVKYLVHNGAHVNINNDEPLRWAYENRYYIICKFLVASGANASILQPLYEYIQDVRIWKEENEISV